MFLPKNALALQSSWFMFSLSLTWSIHFVYKDCIAGATSSKKSFSLSEVNALSKLLVNIKFIANYLYYDNIIFCLNRYQKN